MIIYEIKLPKKENPDKFAKFMRDEYFPAIHKGATRVGQVTSLLLLQGLAETNDSEMPHHFFWQVGWSGVGGGNAHTDDRDIQHKLESFNINIKRIGMFE